jgi:hypothetical protein
MRLAAHALLISIGLFIALAAASMLTYPGGSWLDLHATRHDLLRNFLCDLLGPVAINGQPNPVGSAAMIAAMVILAAGLGILWWALPALFPSTALGRAIRVCGTLSLVGLVAVPLTPPTVSYQLHAAAAFAGGAPGIFAWLFCLVGLGSRRATRALAIFGALALVLVAIGFALYVHQTFFGGGPTILLPASHRIATLFFLGWLVAVALQLKTADGQIAISGH